MSTDSYVGDPRDPLLDNFNWANIYLGNVVYNLILDASGGYLGAGNPSGIQTQTYVYAQMQPGPSKRFDTFQSARCYACNKFFKIEYVSVYTKLTCPHCGVSEE